jgi:hypothetical protein
MATEIGTGTSYPITVPVGSDNADIQTALRYITYGIGGTPTSDSQITSNCIFGKMKLLAPKASPVFTGNGSIAGNFAIGGNLVVSGTIDNDQGTNATFNDKTLTIGSANTTDADADENGIILKGATDKKIIFQNGTGWESTENLNLDSGKTFKIAGTTVLSGTQVLGKTIGGTSTGDIVSTNAAQTLTNKTITGCNATTLNSSSPFKLTGHLGEAIVKATQMYIVRSDKVVTSPSGGTFTVGIGDLSGAMTAASTYAFKLRYFITTSGTGTYTPTTPLVFTQTPVSIQYSLKTYPQAMGTTTTRQGMGTTTNIAPTAASVAGSFVVEVEGFFETNATTGGSIYPKIQLVATASGQSLTLSAGSYIELQKIGSSSTSQIAGTWA